jgi:hypothetical protein
MKLCLAKKIVCEIEKYPMQAPFVLVDKSQKQKNHETWKKRQKMAFGEQKETWIEQVNEQGDIFTDKYLHPQCEYIKNIKKDATDTN